MGIIGLLIFLVIAGVALYLVPLEPGIKGVIVKIVIVVACIWVLIWLLQAFGVMSVHNLQIK